MTLSPSRKASITPSGELKHDDYDVLCDDPELDLSDRFFAANARCYNWIVILSVGVGVSPHEAAGTLLGSGVVGGPRAARATARQLIEHKQLKGAYPSKGGYHVPFRHNLNRWHYRHGTC